ncbi:hypothetical protein [Burkholderia sp. MSMB1498]|uniref:hypothetical protein n=1 Tax=Burkholderia sp. MSMB1498 TaxID=1637842 RepID=UPI000B2096ED|nr:hypothetical protein [Burkholderia sp. MSMB1498]
MEKWIVFAELLGMLVAVIDRNASVRGRVMHRDLEVQGGSGQVVVEDAPVVSRADSAGLTWRTAELFLIAAAAIWAPSLLRRLVNRAAAPRAS